MFFVNELQNENKNNITLAHLKWAILVVSIPSLQQQQKHSNSRIFIRYGHNDWRQISFLDKFNATTIQRIMIYTCVYWSFKNIL